MTPEQLSEISKRAKAATKGPWEVAQAGGSRGTIEYYVRTVDDTYDIAIAGDVCDPITDTPAKNIANAKFIARSREDIPALLVEVERLQKEVADWKRAFAAAEKTQREANSKIYELQGLLSAVEKRADSSNDGYSANVAE